MKIAFLDDDNERAGLAAGICPWPIFHYRATETAFEDIGGGWSGAWAASLDIDNTIGRANGDPCHSFGGAIMRLFNDLWRLPEVIVIHSHNRYAVDLLKEMLEGMAWTEHHGATNCGCPPIVVARFPRLASDPEAAEWRRALLP